MTRRELRRHGFRALAKSSDLFAYGYIVVEWFSPRMSRLGRDSIVYEYVYRGNDPRNVHNRGRALPRMTASTFAEQVEAHRVMGAPAPVRDMEQIELFGGDQ